MDFSCTEIHVEDDGRRGKSGGSNKLFSRRGPIVKRTKLFVAVAVAAMVMVFTTQGFLGERHEVVEKMGTRGRINWSQGIIYAKGIGTAPEKFSQKAESGSSVRKAEVDAYSNLLETIKCVRIDSSSLVKDFVKKDDMVLAQLQGMVKGAQVVKREYLSNGTVGVTLALKVTGGFAQLVLPEDIKHVPEIKTIPRTQPKKEKHEERPGRLMPAPATTVYTGLVLDARGLKGRPALSPRIMDENGQEVYGSAYVSREFAVQQGMAGYGKELKGAQNSPRVSNNPLT
ncbi:MAG: hypothetical protein HWN51_07055, partial [Desulfobacterales bacterium]|nr:hypothetical protein [Desulfobacterales bacterium]